jgi:hypothetical protein
VLLAVSALLAAALGAAGCTLPRQGTPVYVDAWSGKWFDGEGVLLEVSPDQRRCRVAVRNRALVVEKEWIDCRSVHPRRSG